MPPATASSASSPSRTWATARSASSSPCPSPSAWRPGGRFVSTRVLSPDQPPAEGVTVAGIYADPTPARLDRLAANQAQGRTRVTIHRTFRLDEAAAALDAFAAGKVGKLVIVID